MAACRGKLTAYLFFLKPFGFSEDWSKTDLWRDAEKIPGVKPALDKGGSAARDFRATTSGQCLLYDSQGVLLFRGGITDARGHTGDNVGRRSITAIVHQENPMTRKTFVYGCSLFNGGSKIE
jgi:hypothetical protein